MRPPAPSVLIVTGAAFLAGWGLPRVLRPAPVLGQEAALGPGAPAVRPASEGGSRSGQNTVTPSTREAEASSRFPGVADPQVLAALENPDLIAAVRGLIAREQEDHCVDTRLIQLIESLPESRLAELPALLAANPGNEFILRFVLTPWAERQPAAALAWATAQGSTNATVLTSVLTGWTRRDPAAAQEWATAQPLSTNTRALQISLIETLAETDPARALAVLHDTGWIHTNSQSVLRLLKNWGSQDPTAALTGLRGMVAGFWIRSNAGKEPEDPFDRRFRNPYSGLLAAVLSGAGSRSSAEIADFIRQLTPQEASAGADSIARDYLALHPEAVQALASNPNPSVAEKAQLKALAMNGTEGLVEKLMGFQDPAFRQELLGNLASAEKLGAEISRSKVAQASLLQALAGTEEAQRPSLTLSFAQKAAADAPAFAKMLWAQLEPVKQQEGATIFLLNLAPEAAGTALDIWESSPPEVQTTSLRGLVAGLAPKDPQKAIALAMQQSNPEVRNDALAVAFAHWGEKAPQAAAAEMERLAPQLDLVAIKRFLPEAGNFHSGPGSTLLYTHFLRDSTVRDRLNALTPQTPP